MSQRIVIELPAFAREIKSLQGDLPIAGLARTLDMLADSAGFLRYRLDGRMAERNRLQLILRIEGVLSVRCQRCLEGLEYPLEVESTLEFIGDEEELTQEEIEDDSRDFLPLQPEVDVLTLIEDEIILALPPAPRHESCALPETGRDMAVSSPFAVLKSLTQKA